MGNHEFIRQAKKKAMAGMTVTACGFALMMLQGGMTASASSTSANNSNTQTLNVTSEAQQSGAAANQNQTAALAASDVQSAAAHSGANNSTSNAANSNAAAHSQAASDSNSGANSAASNSASNASSGNSANSSASNNNSGSANGSNSNSSAAFNINQVTNHTSTLNSATLSGNAVTISATHNADMSKVPANTRVHQYAILYDHTANQELARHEFNVDEHNLNYTFNVPTDTAAHNWKSDQLYVIFRYALDPYGNHDYIDSDSQYFDFLKQTVSLPTEIKTNNGWFDNISFTDNGVHVSGWNTLEWNNNDHAKELNGQIHHYIQIVDANGTVLSSIEVTGNMVKSRPDVQRIYPGFYNSGQSGFDVVVPITNNADWNNDEMTARSVYTTSSSAATINSSNSVVYSSTPFTRFKATSLPNGQEMGSLDYVSYASGKLHVSGWNTVDWPKDQIDSSHLHHYLIVFDKTTGKQLASKEIKNTARPDVAKVYPNLYNAANSGFSEDFDIDSSAWVNDVISVVSRYSTFAGGNGDDGVANHKADWWTNGFYANKNNFGWLDNVKLDGTTLNVSGWHATNNSQSQTNHFLIVWDKTKSKQLASLKLDKDNQVVRLDVGQAYPGVYNSNNSGFKAAFNATTNDWYTDELQFVSRYSDQSTGNGGAGHYTDYWSNPVKLTGNKKFVNRSSFDHVILSDGSLHVDGWHSTNDDQAMPHSLIILHDDTANSNLATVNVSEGQPNYQLRNDVSRVYPDVSAKSGFNLELENVNQLQFGHQYTIISRRCQSTDESGTKGLYFDSTYTFVFNQHADYIDSINFGQNAPLHISGWMASDASNQASNAYVIVLSNGHELGRTKVTLTARPDVASAYPMIANSGVSGFSVTFDGNNGLPNINANQNALTVVLRFTNDAAGNDGTVHDDVAWQNYYGYNMTANAINRYILNNHIGHANITEHIVVGPRNEAQARNFDGADMHYYNGKPTMVIVHETANPNDSIWGEINYEQQNWRNAFVHTFVDNNNIINIADTNYAAWGAAYPANGYGVQFEQVEVHNGPAFAHELVNAAYYTAYIMKQYDMQPSLAQPNRTGTLWSHHNVSEYLGGTDHTDPDGYWTRNANQFFGTNYTMSDFLQLVKYEMSQL